MNYNLDCIYIKKNVIRKPLVGKDTKDVQTNFVCIHKKNFMNPNGCPRPDNCKGYKPAGIRSINI